MNAPAQVGKHDATNHTATSYPASIGKRPKGCSRRAPRHYKPHTKHYTHPAFTLQQQIFRASQHLSRSSKVFIPRFCPATAYFAASWKSFKSISSKTWGSNKTGKPGKDTVTLYLCKSTGDACFRCKKLNLLQCTSVHVPAMKDKRRPLMSLQKL